MVAKGPGCRTVTTIEGGERLNAVTWYQRPAVKYGSYPGGGGGSCHDGAGERRGGGAVEKELQKTASRAP